VQIGRFEGRRKLASCDGAGEIHGVDDRPVSRSKAVRTEQVHPVRAGRVSRGFGRRRAQGLLMFFAKHLGSMGLPSQRRCPATAGPTSGAGARAGSFSHGSPGRANLLATITADAAGILIVRHGVTFAAVDRRRFQRARPDADAARVHSLLTMVGRS
jgi:hypothetical protein